jgi:glutamyl endopeptidase
LYLFFYLFIILHVIEKSDKGDLIMPNPFGFRSTLLTVSLLCLTVIPLAQASKLPIAIAAKQSPDAPVSNNGAPLQPGTSEAVVRVQNGAYVKGHRGLNEKAEKRVAPTAPRSKSHDTSHMGTESIIGEDTRTQVNDTTAYPYSAIVQIESDIGGCTGWLIGPHTVATAGHCVYDPNQHKWASYARVYPGRNGDELPYGSANAQVLYSVVGWTQNGDSNYDYGAIKLDSDIGNDAGWFGYRWQTGSMDGIWENISGYPGDKTYGTQWEDRDQIRQTAPRKLFYANDTYGGQSGSPVYEVDSHSDCDFCAIAIHTSGVYSGSSYNRGTRITEAVFENFNRWKNQ